MSLRQPASGASERVLVLMSSARNAEITRSLLVRDGVEVAIAASVGELCAMMAAGAAAVLVTEDVLDWATRKALEEQLATQGPWSDLPVLVFSDRDSQERLMNDAALTLGNVTFLDRPVQVRTMLAACQAAIRSRRRQYEARGAIESRDRFLAMLGHELRNPLAAIRFAVELLGRPRSEGARGNEREVIDRQSKSLVRLVDDLLEIARITHGKIVIEREPVDVVELARSVCAAHEPRARGSGLAFDCVVPSERVEVIGDRVRLEQVLGNLVTNAIKYTPWGGEIRVALTATDSDVWLSVQDTGIGLEPEMAAHIFEVFQQADRSLDRAQGGLGLGLTVVDVLARLHGGDVEVKSEGVGKGSEFRVRLPRAAASAAARFPTGPAAPLRGRRIVVVEDNPDLLDLLVAALEGAGHEVSSAADGDTGLARLLSEMPDFAFVDIGLPGIDGFELARRVRAAGATMRLVALTGYGLPRDAEAARAAGFDAHVAKPVELAVLERVMSGLLS